MERILFNPLQWVQDYTSSPSKDPLSSTEIIAFLLESLRSIKEKKNLWEKKMERGERGGEKQRGKERASRDSAYPLLVFFPSAH